MSGPVEALRTGKGGGAAVGCDDPELARLPAVVADQDARQGLLGGCTALELLERERAERGNTCRLRRNGSDAGARPRDDRAHGEVTRLHRTADFACLQVGRNDREGALATRDTHGCVHFGTIARGLQKAAQLQEPKLRRRFLPRPLDLIRGPTPT